METAIIMSALHRDPAIQQKVSDDRNDKDFPMRASVHGFGWAQLWPALEISQGGSRGDWAVSMRKECCQLCLLLQKMRCC